MANSSRSLQTRFVTLEFITQFMSKPRPVLAALLFAIQALVCSSSLSVQKLLNGSAGRLNASVSSLQFAAGGVVLLGEETNPPTYGAGLELPSLLNMPTAPCTPIKPVSVPALVLLKSTVPYIRPLAVNLPSIPICPSPVNEGAVSVAPAVLMLLVPKLTSKDRVSASPVGFNTAALVAIPDKTLYCVFQDPSVAVFVIGPPRFVPFNKPT